MPAYIPALRNRPPFIFPGGITMSLDFGPIAKVPHTITDVLLDIKFDDKCSETAFRESPPVWCN